MEFAELHFGENPWPAIFGLGLGAVVFLGLFFMNQNGRHLMRALGLIGVGLVLLGIDYAWTTDREKIAGTITAMVQAVKRNDEADLRKHLTLSAVYVQNGLPGGVGFESPLGRTLLKQALEQMKFDFLGVRDLQISAGKKTRKGKADFTVMATGTWMPPMGGSAINFPPTPTSWSLGLSKQDDGRWLVDRITPTRLPGEIDSRSNMPGLIPGRSF